MRSHHPHDDRFSAENFGNQPTWLIMDALKYGSKFQQEQLHLAELGISTLTACFVNSNRDPKSGSPAKPSDFWYFTPKDGDGDKLDPVAADTFFSLVSDEKMPSWALAIAPVDKLRSSRVNGVIPKSRVWMRRGVILIAPKISNGVVKVSLALVDGIEGRVAVIDADSGVVAKVFIPNAKKETFWQADVEFELVV